MGSDIGLENVTTYEFVTALLHVFPPLKIDWLWPGRIASGSLTVLAGDPDVGKSYLALDVAARASLGAEWPDGQPNPGAGASVVDECGRSFDLHDPAGVGGCAGGCIAVHFSLSRSHYQPGGENRAADQFETGYEKCCVIPWI